MSDKKIKESIKGGTKYTGLFGDFDLPEPGSITAVIKSETFKSKVELDIEYTVETEIEPGKDKSGKALREPQPPQYSAVAFIPCSDFNLNGLIQVSCYSASSVKEAKQRLLENIGREILGNRIKASEQRD